MRFRFFLLLLPFLFLGCAEKPSLIKYKPINFQKISYISFNKKNTLKITPYSFINFNQKTDDKIIKYKPINFNQKQQVYTYNYQPINFNQKNNLKIAEYKKINFKITPPKTKRYSGVNFSKTKYMNIAQIQRHREYVKRRNGFLKSIAEILLDYKNIIANILAIPFDEEIEKKYSAKELYNKKRMEKNSFYIRLNNN